MKSTFKKSPRATKNVGSLTPTSKSKIVETLDIYQCKQSQDVSLLSPIKSLYPNLQKRSLLLPVKRSRDKETLVTKEDIILLI